MESLVRAQAAHLALRRAVRKDLSQRMARITLTVRTTPDMSLERSLEKLLTAFDRLKQQRRNAERSKKPRSQFAKVVGGAWGLEVSRRRNWNPHVHLFVYGLRRPDPVALVKDWKAITGDSTQVPARKELRGKGAEARIRSRVHYATKRKLAVRLTDRWEVWQATERREKRLRWGGRLGSLQGRATARPSRRDAVLRFRYVGNADRTKRRIELVGVGGLP